jgi:hypothetical protein
MRKPVAPAVLPRTALLLLAFGALAGASPEAESARGAGVLHSARANLSPPVGGSSATARGRLIARWSDSSPGRSRLEIDLTGLRRNSRYTVGWDDPATAERSIETIATLRTRNARRARLALGTRGRHRLPDGVTLDDMAGGRIEVRDKSGRLVLSGEAPVSVAQEEVDPSACRFLEEAVLEDNFDAATAGSAPPDWTVAGTDVDGIEVVVDDTVFDGDAGQSVRFGDTVAADPGAPSMSRAFAAQTGFFAIEFALIADATPSARVVCNVSDSTGAPPVVPTGFGTGLGLYEDGTIGFGIGDTIATVTASTTYHFRVDFDIAAQTFDVSIDGVAVVTDRALDLTSTSLDTISFSGDATATGNGWIDTVRVIHQEQDCPPTANAGPDQVVLCTGDAIPVILDGSASADPEGAELTYTWTGDFLEGTAEGVNPTVTFSGSGVHTVTLIVNDGFFDSAPDDVAIEIENCPPVANAGTDQTVECTGDAIEVVLDGSGSTDPEGAALTYKWTGSFNEGTAEGVNPTVHFPGVGAHTVTLVVNDGLVDSEPDDVVITIQDTTPPELRISGLPTSLWPPNHSLIKMSPTVNAEDACEGSDVTVTLKIRSNEPDNGTGDGNTTGDIVIRSADDFDLRAERSGQGSGRVYTLVWTATDSSGNSTT